MLVYAGPLQVWVGERGCMWMNVGVCECMCVYVGVCALGSVGVISRANFAKDPYS